MPNPPSWSELEHTIVTEVRAAIAGLVELSEDEPLAAIVVWADPFKGWYEVLADTVSRNADGARARNAKMRGLLPQLGVDPDAWKTAMTVARRTQALDFDPRYGEYAFADDPVHSFDVSYEEFLYSPEYAQLNVGGEDGWLEGHVRFVLAKALARLVADGSFSAIQRGPVLRVGYAYPDSSDAIIVALVD